MEMNEEFAKKLRASLEALDTRISALEHLVNDTIIGGLKQAAEEYDDDAKFSDFVDTYKDKYEQYQEPAAILFGEDYDLPSDLYDKLKGTEGYGTEGFDEAANVDAMLAEIQNKIDELQALKDKVEEKVEEEKPETEEKVEVEEEIPDEKQLAEEFKMYNHE